MIASTDFSYWDSSNPVLQSEVREITHIEGRTISFTQPLRFMHYGKIYTPKGTLFPVLAHRLYNF